MISRGLKGDHIKCVHINEGSGTGRQSRWLDASEVPVARRAERKNSEVCTHWHSRNGAVKGVKHRNRMPSEVVESPSSRIFKTDLDAVRSNLL